MLPTLLEGCLQHKSPGGLAEGSICPPAAKSEVAGLRAFLRSRCGNLKAAFYALDAHSMGQVTSDDFVKGLERLGYKEDAMGVFHALDASQSGLISLRAFMQAMQGGPGGEDIETSTRSLQSSSGGEGTSRSVRAASEDAWRSARIPRYSTDSPMARRSSPRHSTTWAEGDPSKVMPSADRPPLASLAVPPTASSGAELQVRLARVEEQCVGEQRQRADMETRLVQHVDRLVSVSISEQLDALRQQLIEERMQRQVDITAVRASLESMRAEARKAGYEAEAGQRRETAATVAELGTRLEELASHHSARLGALELQGRPACGSDGGSASSECTGRSTMPGELEWQHGQELSRLRQLVGGLEDRFGDLKDQLDGLEGTGVGRDRILALVDERLAAQRAVLFQEQSSAMAVAQQAAECAAAASQRCTGLGAQLQEAGNGPLCSLERAEALVQRVTEELRQEWHRAAAERVEAHANEQQGPQLEALLGERLNGLREEWRAALEEERARGCERAQVLGRALGEEFERSIVSQAVAEARAEAKAEVFREVQAQCKQGGEAAQGSEAADVQRVADSLSVLEGEVSGLVSLARVEEEQREGARRAVASLRSDLDSLGKKLQERVLDSKDDICNRLRSLEAAFQHLGDAKQLEVQGLCFDRFEALDKGLARVNGEVKQHGDALERLRRKHQALSEGIQGRLQAVLAKLDSKCVESIGPVLDHLGSSMREESVFSARERSPTGSICRSPCPSSRLPPQPSPASSCRQPPRSPHQVNRSQSCAELSGAAPEVGCGPPNSSQSCADLRGGPGLREDTLVHSAMSTGSQHSQAPPASSSLPPTPAPVAAAASPPSAHRCPPSPAPVARQGGAPRLMGHGPPLPLRSRLPAGVQQPVVSQRIVSVPQSRLRCPSTGGTPTAGSVTRQSSAPSKH